jgi:predicted ribonuclease YlaK
MTNKEKFWVADTNFLYNGLEETIDSKKIVLMSTVRQEADKHKNAIDGDLRFKARKLNRFVFENYDKFHHDVGEYNPEVILGLDYDRGVMDNRIVACALVNGYGVLTNDLNLYSTAKAFGIEVETLDSGYKIEDSSYKGFKEVHMLSNEHQDFYTNKLAVNEYGLNINEYLIIKDDVTGKEIDALKWNGEYHVAVKSKTLKSQKLGVFKPYDLYQTCAVDSVMSNQFSMLRGRAGVAKTAIALSYAMQELSSTSGKYSKIIVFSNAIPTKNAFYHGLVKGDLNSKLLSSSIGNILASKMGDKNEVEAMLITEQLTILPASDIRGFDSSGMNALIIITECQNWSRELLKLAIQRTGKDCKLILEGDNSTQLDDRMFEGANNGMTAASEVFRGQPYYGEIELQKIYRSEIAERAEQMTLLN